MIRLFLRPATWLISQLTFPRKLELVGLLFIIPLAALTALLLPRLNADITFAERELIGIEAIQPIKNLTLQAQSHRGTTQLALSGDMEAPERLTEIHARAEKSINELDAFNQRYGAQLGTTANWDEIKFKWAYIQAHALTLPPDKSFLLHTDFIHCLNAFLAKIGDASYLILDSEIPSYYLARIVLEQLPDMIENFGQTRAMSAVAAQHQSLTAVERHQLSILVGEAEKLEKTLSSQTGKVFSAAPDFKARLQPSLQEAANVGHFFVFDVQNDILLPTKISARGQSLYDAGTLAIDTAYRLCNATLPLLQEIIQDRKHRLEREKQLALGLTALILVLLAYLFIGFAVSFLGNLTALKNAASRVARGDFHAYAAIATRDEMRDIATSFNHMTDSLRDSVSQLRSSEDKYHKIMEQAGDMILVADLAGNLVDANRMAENMLGYSREELLQRNILSLTPDSEKTKTAEALARLAIEGSCEEEHLALRKDGRTIPVHAKCVLIEHDGDKLAMGIFRDISAIRESQRHIEFLATHDPLTRLPNRSLLYDRIQQALARSERELEPFALMFIDLDNFKDINDSHGHDSGDQLLQEAAARIQSCIRGADTAARLGGDEFTILIAGADRKTAASTAQRIIEELSAPFVINRQEIGSVITASIGISLYPQDGTTRHLIMKYADEAMYRAKADGKNAYRFFSEA